MTCERKKTLTPWLLVDWVERLVENPEVPLRLLRAAGMEVCENTLCKSINRFWSKMQTARAEECWIWTGAKYHFGHGCCVICGKRYTAHRIAWLLRGNTIPPGMCVLHRCDNPPCCNPDHCFIGTRGENTLDMIRKGRQVPPRGERCATSKLTIEQVLNIRQRFGIESAIALAKEFQVNRRHIYRLVNWLRWAHIP